MVKNIKEKLKKIELLTEYNNHTQARIETAKMFSYCGRYRIIFKKIKDIQELTGYLPYHLGEYRNKLTDEMFKEIELKEGEDIIGALYQVL